VFDGAIAAPAVVLPLHAFRPLLPLMLTVVAVLLAYDGSVVDVAATKRLSFHLAVATWGLVALLRGWCGARRPLSVALFVMVVTWALSGALLAGASTAALLDKPLYYGVLALALLLFREVVRSPATWPALVQFLTLCAVALSTATWVEVLVLGGEPRFSGAPVATLGNPNHLGAALVLLLPPVLALALHRARDGRWWLVASLLTSAVGLSGSYLAMLALLPVVLWLLGQRGLPWRMRWVASALLVAALAVGALAPGAMGQRPATRPAAQVVGPGADRAAGDRGLARAFQGRLYLFARGMEAWGSAPWWGLGSGEYAWAFAAAQAEYLSETPDDLRFHTRQAHAHCDPLELLIEHGLLGLTLLVALWWWVRRRWGEGRAERRDWRLASWRWLGLGIFLWLSLGHFALYSPQVAVFGLIYGAMLFDFRLAVPRRLELALAGIAAGFMVLLLSLAVVNYEGERRLVRGLEALEAGAWTDADDHFSRAHRALPDGRALFYRGTLRLQEGDWVAARALLERAAYLLPFSEVHFNLALALCATGEREAALQRLEIASRLDPQQVGIEEAQRYCGGEGGLGGSAAP